MTAACGEDGFRSESKMSSHTYSVFILELELMGKIWFTAEERQKVQEDRWEDKKPSYKLERCKKIQTHTQIRSMKHWRDAATDQSASTTKTVHFIRIIWWTVSELWIWQYRSQVSQSNSEYDIWTYEYGIKLMPNVFETKKACWVALIEKICMLAF